MKHIYVAASLALAALLVAQAPAAAEDLAAPSRQAMRLWGTGFVIDREGHLLTADHVTRDCAAVTAYRQGVRSDAVVVARDGDDDLSLLKSTDLLGAPVAFAGSRRTAGPLVLVAAYPDLAGVVENGGGQHRLLFNGMIMSPPSHAMPRRLYLVSDAQPGSSGSPVVDAGGFVTAIVTAKVNWRDAASRPGGVGELRLATSAVATKEFLRRNGIDFLDEDGAVPIHTSSPGNLLERSEVRIECRGSSPTGS